MKLAIITSIFLIMILFTGRGYTFGESDVDQGNSKYSECIPPSEVFSSTANADKSLDELEESFEELKKQYESLKEELKEKIPDSEELKRLKSELDRLREEMKKSGKAIQEKIEKEFIPKLKEEIDKLRDKLLKPDENIPPGETIPI